MKIFVVIFLFGICECLDKHQFRCDYTYYPQADGWFKLHTIPADWHEARLRCHLEGAVLASPLTLELERVMASMIRYRRGLKYGVYTGIHATFSRGDFYSVEGVPLSKIEHYWAAGQPDNFEDRENCIVTDRYNEFSDVDCRETHPYICYKKDDKSMVLNDCGTIDHEYVFYNRTGSCYKFHRTPRTWSRAYMACAAEGGYLAIINSDKEAEVIKEIFAQNPASKMVGRFWKDVAFVGFHDWDEHGEWLTIEGKTLEEAGYAKFAPGEPNNSTTGEYCGAVYRSARFDDLWCMNSYAFICEKSPDSLLCPKYDNSTLV